MSINHEFCIKNEKLCIKNEEFCIKNDEFCRQKAPSMMLKAELKQQQQPVEEVNAAARGLGFRVPQSSAVQRRADAGRSSPQRARPLDLSPGRQRSNRAAAFKLGGSFGGPRRAAEPPRKAAAAQSAAAALAVGAARARKIMSGSPARQREDNTVSIQRSKPSAFDHFAYATDSPQPMSSSSESEDKDSESEDEEDKSEEEQGGEEVEVAVRGGALPKADVSSDASVGSSSDEQG